MFFDFQTYRFAIDILKKCEYGSIPDEFDQYKYNGSFDEYAYLEFEDKHLFLLVSAETIKCVFPLFYRAPLNKTKFKNTTIYIIPIPDSVAYEVVADVDDVNTIHEAFMKIVRKYEFLYKINYSENLKNELSEIFSQFNVKDAEDLAFDCCNYIGCNYSWFPLYYFNDDEIRAEEFLANCIKPASRHFCYNALFECMQNISNIDVNLFDVILDYSHG